VILTLVDRLKNGGFWSIVYLAGMIAINPEYYEAATWTEPTRGQKMWHITLPLLKPLIIINVLLSIGRIFYADFGLFYQVTRNAPELYRPPTSSTLTSTERSRPSGTWAWRRPRARSRPWSASSSYCCRTGWCAAPSLKVLSSSPTAALQAAQLPRDAAGQGDTARPPPQANSGCTRAWHFSAYVFRPLILLISASLSSRDRHQHLRLLASAGEPWNLRRLPVILNDPQQILSATP